MLNSVIVLVLSFILLPIGYRALGFEGLRVIQLIVQWWTRLAGPSFIDLGVKSISVNLYVLVHWSEFCLWMSASCHIM